MHKIEETWKNNFKLKPEHACIFVRIQDVYRTNTGTTIEIHHG